MPFLSCPRSVPYEDGESRKEEGRRLSELKVFAVLGKVKGLGRV
jgi:hypothetical protein